MKKLLVGMGVLALIAVSSALANPAISPTEPTVVFPTGEFPTDAHNVQAAVDLGGSVLLKATNAAGAPATFNFGTPEPPTTGKRVLLTRDVAIFGERAGGRMTTIQGGVIPFFGTMPVRSRIEGIHFDGPLLSAIIIISSTGSDILGNRVSRVVGSFLPFLGLDEGRGIKFLGNNDPDGAITGRVRVSGNVIEDMHADLSDAIVFDAVAADIEIAGNRIETVQSSGVLVIDSKALVSIMDNVVIPGAGDPGPEFSFGNGMTIVDGRAASYFVARNTVICENPQADGILLFSYSPGPDPVIASNVVAMSDSLFGGITLAGRFRDALIGQNRVEGTGAFAIDLMGLGFDITSTTLQGNNVARFAASVADVFLDPFVRDSVVVGSGGTVIDLGVNNRITGFSTIGGGDPIGSQISSAMARKRELLGRTLEGGS